MTANQETFDRIAERVESGIEESGVPGATFGVQIDGESYTAGIGVTHAEHPLAVTDETLFQIGSITKTVTATAMMRLVEQGRLDPASAGAGLSAGIRRAGCGCDEAGNRLAPAHAYGRLDG